MEHVYPLYHSIALPPFKLADQQLEQVRRRSYAASNQRIIFPLCLYICLSVCCSSSITTPTLCLLDLVHVLRCNVLSCRVYKCILCTVAAVCCQKRTAEIQRLVRMGKDKRFMAACLLSPDVTHAPFHVNELAFNVIGPHCVTQQIA